MTQLQEDMRVKLSKREAQVAEKISQGLTNQSIAEQLFISERTVKFHCTNIFRKLAIDNRKMLIARQQTTFMQPFAC